MSNLEKNALHHTSDINSTYAVLDFETTGLNPKHGDRAIEIGISLLSGGKEVDTFSSLINPGRRIDPFITSLTGISNAMVATAPPARDVMQRALDFTKDAQLVAHNAGFDRKFWRHEIQHELGVSDDRDFLCTLMLSRRIFQTFGSHKLGRIAQELGVRESRSHRALSDAQVTTQVLSVMFDRLRLAYPDKHIDPQFLKTYQKRARTGLPDLTIEPIIVPEVKQAIVRTRTRTTTPV
jgi:DNA polymerase-3 subunit epsilon